MHIFYIGYITVSSLETNEVRVVISQFAALAEMLKQVNHKNI